MGYLRRFRIKQVSDKRVGAVRGSHRLAVLQALLVTFLWSTSWVLIKIGLRDIPALTFAGLRYVLAFLLLVPLALRSGRLAALRGLSVSGWWRLIALGVLFYTITQGAQFLGLAYLPAVTVNVLLNLTTLIVAVLGMIFLAERPTALQWGGILAFLIGVGVFFYPLSIPLGEAFGLTVVMVGVVANALSSILGRSINREKTLPPLTVTAVSMGIGAVLLLVTGLFVQGMPQLGLSQWLIIIWLAAVNTAFAFTLWNQTLRTLSAFESNIINNTMLIQIAALAWIFLDEPLTAREIAGMLLVGLGAVIVQLRPRRG